MFIPRLDDLHEMGLDVATNRRQLLGRKPVIRAELHGLQPELAHHPLSSDVNMLGLVTIETVEVEPVRAWCVLDPRHLGGPSGTGSCVILTVPLEPSTESRILPSSRFGHRPGVVSAGRTGIFGQLNGLFLEFFQEGGIGERRRADVETGRKHTLNILLWVLQVLAALLYGASGIMKVFMFDEISKDVPSFGALPREAWMALGILELLCVVGLIVPSAFRWMPGLTVVAATVLAIESLVFVWVHVEYREIAPIVMSGVLGLVMAFVAYGRMVLRPI
jgi:hypothetical protein